MTTDNTYQIDIFDLGPSSLLFSRRNDPATPPLAVDAPFPAGSLAGDVEVLANEGAVPFMERVKSHGCNVRSMPAHSPENQKRIMTFEDGNLEVVGVHPSVAYWAGFVSGRQKTQVISDTVGITEVAQRLSVAPSTAANWPYRPDFPSTVQDTPRRWRWVDIESWAEGRMLQLGALTTWGFKTGRLKTEDD